MQLLIKICKQIQKLKYIQSYIFMIYNFFIYKYKRKIKVIIFMKFIHLREELYQCMECEYFINLYQNIVYH